MDSFNSEDEREALEARREEMRRQLCVLLTEKETLEHATFTQRQEALLSEIHEIEYRLADLRLDEQSLQQMEGGE